MHSRVLDSCGLVRVQTWDSQAIPPARLQQTLGVAWSQQIGTVASSRAADILCIGPTDWLVAFTNPDPTAPLQELDAVFAGTTFRATNMSQALVRVELQGPNVRTLLLKGSSLDLHPSHFAPGRCTRTRLASLPAILRCTGPVTFECIVTSSYRDYLLSWLTDAAEEFLAATA